MHIICLIRESIESIEERLKKSLQKYKLFSDDISRQLKFLKINNLYYFYNLLLRDRVRVIAGDIALVKFSLSDEDYHYLTYDVDVVIHAAAYVNLIYPYQVY